MIAEYKGADDDIVRWQSADGTIKTAHINDLILAYETNRGKWIPKTLPLTLSDGHKDCVQCSNCKTHWDVATNYCPNCGARMEGE